MTNKQYKEMKYTFIGILIMLTYGLLMHSCNNQKPDSAGIALFNVTPENKTALLADPGVTDFTRVTLSDDAVRQIQDSKSVDITVPYKNEIYTLHIEELELYTPDFNVMSNNKIIPAMFTQGHYYSGYVVGKKDSSTVSLSINADGSLEGAISIAEMKEDIIIVKASKTNSNQYYTLSSIQKEDSISFNCNVLDALPRPEIGKTQNTAKIANGCLTVDLILDYGTYQHFGSIAAASTWITSLYTAVITMYQNEQIKLAIKSITVNTEPDNVPADANGALNYLVNKYKNDPKYTATFVQFVRGKNGGSLSGLAYVGTMCVNDYRFSYTEPMWTYSVYPGYSWSTMVLTHELGHNCGSPHTQSCSWPGGAIDNCYTVEGSCPPGPAPVNGGTVMSYCHMTQYGIKMQNGFGPLPGNKIRYYYNTVGCINCTATPPVVVSANLALNKPARQNSDYPGYPAANAFDGNVNTFSHTLMAQYPWIQVDLGQTASITGLDIVGRQSCCQYRLREFKIFASNSNLIPSYTDPALYAYSTGAAGLNRDHVDGLSGSGRYITLMAKNFQAGDFLSIAELGVYGTFSTLVCKDSTITVHYKVTVEQDRDSTKVIQVCR